jgi:probable HAF family extracellular repeat protein
MKSRMLMCLAAITFLASLAILPRLAAQANQDHRNRHNHHHYQLIDLGTFGGPASYFSNGADGILNNQGAAVGWADTPTPDPFPSFCFDPDCFVAHAFQWKYGQLTDLGTLAEGWSSQATWISKNGNISGISQNSEIDPLLGIPEFRAVLWQNSGITDLGTLENGYESFALGVNNSAQVAGLALNTISDPFCLFAPGFCNTQTRAFLWRGGVMQDLGTLGGPDAIAFYLNEHSQVTGYSYTNSTPNSVADACGANVPTAAPFIWEKGKGMTDLGTLGGTCGIPAALNSRGQVVGLSDLAGDSTFHPFLWDKSSHPQLRDLGTLGGNNGNTNWIDDVGEVVGKADLPGSQTHDAFLWKNGVMTDLGTLPGDSCSNAYQVNSRGQVVGTSEDQTLCVIPTGEHAFLWENGGPMVDLNTLIAPNSSLQLTFAFAINDRGEIVGTGLPPGCAPQNIEFCGHAFVLVPCDDKHAGIEGCDYSLVQPNTSVSQMSPAVRDSSSRTLPPPLMRRMTRYRFPGFAFGPRN